jgi:hypothetical protein
MVIILCFVDCGELNLYFDPDVKRMIGRRFDRGVESPAGPRETNAYGPLPSCRFTFV